MALRSICCLRVADATTFSMLMKALPLSDNYRRPVSRRGRRVGDSLDNSRKNDSRQRSPRWKLPSLYRVFKLARSQQEKIGTGSQCRALMSHPVQDSRRSTDDFVSSGRLEESFFFPGSATSNANNATMSATITRIPWVLGWPVASSYIKLRMSRIVDP